MLSEEEVSEIKQKLTSHIESTFSAEQAANAKQQIESMNSEQLENFLEKNKLIKTNNAQNGEGGGTNECVFCAIVSDRIKSVKIGENQKAIAILEINPISIGHSLVIPKEHSDNISKKVLELAEKVSKLLKKKLSAKKIEISKSKLFGHEVINILPVYNNENFNSEKKSATIEELENIKEELEKKTQKISKPKTKKIKEILWLPKRIP